MPLGVPSLDQLGSTPLDQLSFVLDNESELLKLEFSNPNIDQLASWGLLDNLDTFGNIDSLSSLAVKQSNGSISASASISGVSVLVRSVSASPSVSASVSSTPNRVQSVVATIVSAGGAFAGATFTVVLSLIHI